MNFIPLGIGWVVGINILQETTQVVEIPQVKQLYKTSQCNRDLAFYLQPPVTLAQVSHIFTLEKCQIICQ